MPRIVHFEVMAEDPERASAFYGKVFGWEINKWEGGDYWLVSTGARDTPGIDGGIGKSQGEPLTINVVDVDSVDAYTDKALAAGGEVVLPKMAVPGVGWVVYCKDTEGLVFGMMQADPDAR